MNPADVPGRRPHGSVVRIFASCGLALLWMIAVLRSEFPHRFVWISAIAASTCALGTRRTAGPGLRRVAIAGLSLAVTFGLLELGFETLERLGPERVEVAGTWVTVGDRVRDATLGYVPRPGTYSARATSGERLLYDVTYTISNAGVRVTTGAPNGDTWLFMGCSYVFGEGVSDDDTLPSCFSAQLAHAANVVNLGFHGYGPHQVLRALETGLAAPFVTGRVRQIVYVGMSDHPRRAAGGDAWDLEGPRYTLRGDTVALDGPFYGGVIRSLLSVASKSALLRFALDRTLYRADAGDDDVERYVRILEQAARVARARFDTDFTIVYWDDEDATSRRVEARLRRSALPILWVSEVIPRREWPDILIPIDRHPNVEANRRLAAALAKRLSGTVPARR